MIGRAIGALVGAEVERGRGESGLKGALIGTVAMAALRRMGPLGLVIGGGWAAKQALDRRRAARASSAG
ncbi:hypothetical protein [uncultured Sphingomonas sp.]|uniref:hypothetical protein n=1 Tax=uncultured Sphingomonas sp. TaxID=158754 RepID=UPI0035CC8CD1